MRFAFQKANRIFLLVFSVYYHDVEFHADFSVVSLFDGYLSVVVLYYFAVFTARNNSAHVETVLIFLTQERF